MPYGLACSYGCGVDDSLKPLGWVDCRWRSFEKRIDSTHAWGLVFTEYGSDEFLWLHCPAGRRPRQPRSFQRHGRQRLLVVLLRLVCVHCLGPPPRLRQQLHRPQRLQPYQRLFGSLSQKHPPPRQHHFGYQCRTINRIGHW